METTEGGQKRCVYCGRFYKPDPRARKTQKSCHNATCKVKRKRESHKRWLAANPDYFKGRYSEVKAWREKHPDYQRLWRKRVREIQDKIPPAEPVKTMVLVIPDKILKNEIQDEIRLVWMRVLRRRREKGLRDTRFDGFMNPGCSTMTPCDGHGATRSSTTRSFTADIFIG